MSANGALLTVTGLETYFPLGKGWRVKREWVRAVDGVDFQVNKGEILGIVGESGCGKTVTSLSLIGLVANPGKIEAGLVPARSEIVAIASKLVIPTGGHGNGLSIAKANFTAVLLIIKSEGPDT